jgi:hypothetical protein
MRAFCVVAGGLFVGLLAWAQTGVGVSPPRAVFAAAPGQVIEGRVFVDHPGRTGAMRVKAFLNDVLVDPAGEPVYLDPGVQPRSLAPWTNYAPLSFTLEPKEVREVRYTIRVPEDARDGTYWAVLFFDSGPLEESEARGVGVRMRVRVGHVIYVEVGRITRSGRIEGVRYRPPAGKNPPQLRIKFRNTGNGLMRLNGRVELRGPGGEVVALATVRNAASLPGMAYEIGAPLDRTPPPGRYVALVRLDYGEAEVIVAEGEVNVP